MKDEKVMTVDEAFDLFSGLQGRSTIMGEKGMKHTVPNGIPMINSTKLAYCINKNIKGMDKELNPYRIMMPERIQEYNCKKKELFSKLKPEEDTNPEIEALDKEYEKDISDWKKQTEESFKKLQEPFNFILFKIKKEDLPETLNALQLKILEPLIIE